MNIFLHIEMYKPFFIYGYISVQLDTYNIYIYIEIDEYINIHIYKYIDTRYIYIYLHTHEI